MVESWYLGTIKSLRLARNIMVPLEIPTAKRIKAFFQFTGLYGKYVENISPNWRWHNSASWGTGQIPIWRIEVPNTRSFMLSWFLELLGTLFLSIRIDQISFENLRKTPNVWNTSYFSKAWYSRIWTFQDFEMSEKTRAEKSRRSV